VTSFKKDFADICKAKRQTDEEEERKEDRRMDKEVFDHLFQTRILEEEKCKILKKLSST
jgi:hypothetical protein